MPALGHGTAITYPYGFFNWTSAALVWPLMADYATTVSSVIGAVGCLVATWFAFPELRRSWWLVAMLLNPAVIQALLFGQQSFAWAAMLFVFGIAAWRREHWLLAAVLVGAGQLNHAAVVLPMAAVIVILRWRWEPDRRRLARWYLLSVLLALPGVYAVFTSTAYGESTWRDRLVNFVSTLGPRLLIVVVPIALCLVARHIGPRWSGIVVVVMIGLNIAIGIPLHAELALLTLEREPRSVSMDSFVKSVVFQPDATYRVLRGGDAKLGMYVLLKAGGRLDSEFFPESAAIRSFANTTSYQRLLCDREVDYVLAFHSYDVTRRTNEHAMLRTLVADGRAKEVGRLGGYEGYVAYSVAPACLKPETRLARDFVSGAADAHPLDDGRVIAISDQATRN